MDVFLELFRWIGAHANKLAGTLRAFFYMGSLMRWWELTADQLIGIMAFVEAFLYMFVESNTVSKARVGERIDEKVAARMGTGNGTLVVLLAVGALLLSGCAQATQRGVQVEHQLTTALLQIDARGDRLAGCVSPATAPQSIACQTFNRVMVPALEAEQAFNRALRDQNIMALSNVVLRLGTVMQTVQTLFTGTERDALVAEIRRAVATAVAMPAGGGQ